MKLSIFSIVLILAATSLRAASTNTLTTPSYKITVKVCCPEYNVTCDDVRYVGISLKSGKSIALIGRTVHTIGPDGVTPAHFLGYEFKSGKTTYFVGEGGELRVTQGMKVLVEEHGTWKQ